MNFDDIIGLCDEAFAEKFLLNIYTLFLPDLLELLGFDRLLFFSL